MVPAFTLCSFLNWREEKNAFKEPKLVISILFQLYLQQSTLQMLRPQASARKRSQSINWEWDKTTLCVSRSLKVQVDTPGDERAAD